MLKIPSEAEPIEALFGEKTSVEVLLGEPLRVVVGDLLLLRAADELRSGLLGEIGTTEGAIENAGETVEGGVAHSSTNPSAAALASQARRSARNFRHCQQETSTGHS